MFFPLPIIRYFRAAATGGGVPFVAISPIRDGDAITGDPRRREANDRSDSPSTVDGDTANEDDTTLHDVTTRVGCG